MFFKEKGIRMTVFAISLSFNLSRPPGDTLISVLQDERIKQDQTSLCEDWRSPSHLQNLVLSKNACSTKISSLYIPWTLRTCVSPDDQAIFWRSTIALYTKIQQKELRFLAGSSRFNRIFHRFNRVALKSWVSSLIYDRTYTVLL